MAVERIMAAQVLGEPPVYLAVHELDIPGTSENALATRLSEGFKEGRVHGRYRRGKPFKEWGPPLVAEHAASTVESQEECGECSHYPAYCKNDGCTAWNPDKPNNRCDCTGRKPPKTRAALPPEWA